jgi:hypothetical protein
VHGDRLAALQDALELLGIGNAERTRRNRLHAVREHLDAGMRIAVIVRADRPDDDGDCALAAGDCRTLAAWTAEIAVARAILRPRHGVRYEDDLAANRFVGRASNSASN